ncbi:GGDEF domain-containing protein [Photobacterium leiognathi]|uniref:GGDEF domain-containing protein n=1 Tax=Photobacterium leiognathi TaxID=553611 RepID=UPI000769CFB2|nr:GGDEF domain-containing protein [Photobacterium leiognathi]
MTDINAVVSEVSSLKQRLDQAQLSYRDASLKSRREIVILKRLITRLVIACRGINKELDERLQSISHELEQPTDISKLIPRLAIVERLVTQQADIIHKQNLRLDQKIHQAGETLSRYRDLPVQLRRDLRAVLSHDSDVLLDNHLRILRIVELYERTIKLVSANKVPQLAQYQAEPTSTHQLELISELQYLITELDFNGEYGDKLQEIKNQLTNDIDTEKLATLQFQVLRLILDATLYERQASQTFLNNINGDLAELQKNTNQTAGKSLVIHQHRGELDSELSQVSQQLKTEINTNQSLKKASPELTSVALELDSIVERNIALKEREQALIEQLQHNENQIQQLIEQTHHYRQRLQDQEKSMLRDSLTQVYNRSAFMDRIEHEYRNWLRYQHPLAVALIDIDNFATINDNFGHLAGDKALKIIAKSIQQCLSDTDCLARVSGDNFMLLMPDSDEQRRKHLLTKIREAISRLPFRFKDKNISVSVSIGATLFEGNDDHHTVIERTEKALVSAQNAGTNRLIWIS